MLQHKVMFDSNVNISPQTIMNRYNYGTYLVTTSILYCFGNG